MSDFSLSVIVPVFNEIELLAESVAEIDSFLGSHFADYEILIIESGSTDGSAETCDTLARDLPHVKVVHEGARNGFGSALKLGYRTASKDLVWLVTADIPFPLTSILEARPLMEKVDCVLSHRTQDERSLFRQTQSIVYNLLMKTLLRLRVRHVNSAFKLFRREVIQSLPLVSNGWFVDAEILYWIQRRRISFVEIPVLPVNRTAGESKISSLTPLYMLGEAMRFVFSRKQS